MVKPRTVAILGASANPERYSHMLLQRLLAKGFRVYPIHPALKEIAGQKAYARVEDIPGDADVLSLYVNAERSERLAEGILASGVPKVVFNPGAENPELMARLQAKGVDAVEACSLVLHGMGRL